MPDNNLKRQQVETRGLLLWTSAAEFQQDDNIPRRAVQLLLELTNVLNKNNVLRAILYLLHSSRTGSQHEKTRE